MRTIGNQNIDVVTTSQSAVATTNVPGSNSIGKQGSNPTEDTSSVVHTQQSQILDNIHETKAKIQEAVAKMNEMLEINNNSSKFIYHEDLERYYVTVVDSQTEEVVKEIPPKKLLDAFYEMQKLFGMIVDEKI